MGVNTVRMVLKMLFRESLWYKIKIELRAAGRRRRRRRRRRRIRPPHGNETP